MDLKQIKGLGPAKTQKLRAAGIGTVEALARSDPAAVAAASGIPLDQVKGLKHRAAALALLEDLKGVGPGTLETLSDSGAESLRELYDASADWLEAELKVVQRKLAQFQSEAERLAQHVATEAKTPEGRQRLAIETSRLARAGAEKAERSGRQALVTAQRAARDIQKRAPFVLKQAEVRVKEAETRLKAAAAKTEKVLRAEAEKARARTERVVRRAKSRVGQD
ncbi:MAG: DUF4332 domain-containing protein [Thermoplasmatota archaeon]